MQRALTRSARPLHGTPVVGSRQKNETSLAPAVMASRRSGCSVMSRDAFKHISYSSADSNSWCGSSFAFISLVILVLSTVERSLYVAGRLTYVLANFSG